MSYNGSGTFNINTAGQPVVTGTVISTTAFNALTADLGTGLSTAITKDGQTVATARIPFAAGINSSLVTDATNTTTGSIITAGGVGIAKALFVGTTLNVAGASTLAAITGTFNGTVGATTPAAGAFTTLSATGTLSGGTSGTGYSFSGSAPATSLTLDSSGNLGLGVTPSAWGSGFKAVENQGGALYSGSANANLISQNFYFNGTNNIYKNNGLASAYSQNSGSHEWYSAASGTAGNPISFTQAMTLDASGNLLVGLTSGLVGGARMSIQPASATGVGIETNGSSGYYPMWFQVAGAQKGYITTTTGGTTYNTTSDYRLKENIQPMTGALAKVAQLKPCTYVWKETGDSGQGFIAHELAEVVPECVSGEKDGTYEQSYEVSPAVKDEQGNIVTPAEIGTQTVPFYQGVDTSNLVATLTAAIQEQQAIITALTTRITALEAK